MAILMPTVCRGRDIYRDRSPMSVLQFLILHIFMHVRLAAMKFGEADFASVRPISKRTRTLLLQELAFKMTV